MVRTGADEIIGGNRLQARVGPIDIAILEIEKEDHNEAINIGEMINIQGIDQTHDHDLETTQENKNGG